MTQPAKDGRETLQEQVRRSTARMANECSVRLDLWCEHSSVCLQLANDHDAAQAEIARLKENQERMICNSCGTITRDGECDCDISPETKGAKALENYADAMCAEARRLSQAAPLPVAEDVVESAKQAFADVLGTFHSTSCYPKALPIEIDVAAGLIVSRINAAGLLRQPEAVSVRGESRDIAEFDPVPADGLWQPEAAPEDSGANEVDPVCVNAHDRCYGGAGGPCPYCERRNTPSTPAPASAQMGPSVEQVERLKKALILTGHATGESLETFGAGFVSEAMRLVDYVNAHLPTLYDRASAQDDLDYFGSLVARARASAARASAKFPQPNYVALKVAEEAGEVVRGCVHYAEKRMDWSEVEGEIVQLLAMLIRLVTEGDQVNGITPPVLSATGGAK